MADPYPVLDLPSDPSFLISASAPSATQSLLVPSYKLFFADPSKKSKPNIKVSEQNKLHLIKFLNLLIDYQYNSHTYSKGLTILQSYFSKLSEQLQESNQLLLNKQSEISNEIEELSQKISRFEEDYKEIILKDKKEFGKVKVESITDVGEIKEQVEESVRYEEKKMEIEKNIEFCKEYYELLQEKYRRLYSDDLRDLGVLFNDLMVLNQFFDYAKMMASELASVQSLGDVMVKPMILNEIAGLVTKMGEVQDRIEFIKERNFQFRLGLAGLEGYWKIYEELVVQFKILAVQKAIEPVCYRDLENLITLKLRYAEEVKDYSPIWILKHFQKNACLIYEETCKVFDFFDRLQIKCLKDYETGGVRIELIGNYLPNLRNITVTNYKSEFITSKFQENIKENIQILHLNLSRLFDSISSLAIINNLTISFKIIKLDNLKLIDNTPVPKEYKFLVKIIKQIEACLNAIQLALSKFSIIKSEGIVVTPIIETYFDSQTQEIQSKLTRAGKSGIINAVLITPKFSRIQLSHLAKFPNHSNFKLLRLNQRQNLHHISQVEAQLNFTNSIQEKINQLTQRLTQTIPQNQIRDQADITNLTDLTNTWLRPVLTEKMLIDRKNFFAVFGSVFTHLTFRKPKLLSKSKPVYIRNKVTLTQFFNAFIDNLNNRVRDNTATNVESLFSKKNLQLGSFVTSFFNEEIVGSFKDDQGLTQRINLGVVEEKWDKSLFEVCKNLAFVMLVQNSKIDIDDGWVARKNDLEDKFVKILQEYDSSLYKKIAK